MTSLAFVVPAHGRIPLARICLTQLRRTCDALTDYGVAATAVVVACDENLDTARDLGFATVERNNEFLSRKFNDGIQMACDPNLSERGGNGQTGTPHGRYLVTGGREYRGHAPGTEFVAQLEPGPEGRAVARGDIQLLERTFATVEPGSYTLTDELERPADFVVPCGSDDFVGWRLFTDLPAANEVHGFQRMSFVREDGAEMVCRFIDNDGGCGVRVYPSQVVARAHYRPADEDRVRGCDTSILTNLRRMYDAVGDTLRIWHMPCDARQLVDWKSGGEQVTPYDALGRHPILMSGNPFEELAGFHPDEALDEMQALYTSRREAGHQENSGAERLLSH